MEIFIVEVDRVYNSQILEYDTRAYSTEEKAKKALKEFVDEERKYCERDWWTIGCDDDDYFLAYEDGNYMHNHVEATVRLLEVM